MNYTALEVFLYSFLDKPRNVVKKNYFLYVVLKIKIYHIFI